MSDDLLSMVSGERPAVAGLFNRIIKGYLGELPEGKSSKERQAKLQKLILDAVENKKSKELDDEGEE